MRRLSAGVYATLDGRYQIERNEGESTCEHPLCDVLHGRFLTRTGDGRGLVHWVRYPIWTVVDVEADRQIGGQEFETLAEARSCLEHHLAKALSPSEPW